jgi:glycosyltransferase involved in cell wall biosynthesis
MKKKVIIIGPAYPLRGGLASFDERLAREFMSKGYETIIYTFSLQYPSFLFPGTTQYSSDLAPKDLTIKVCINSVNPLNWIKVGWKLKNEAADIIVIRYWLPFMGPCLGSILRIAGFSKKTRKICIADNVLPHEKRPGDTMFTKYFLPSAHAFVTMSKKVMGDLKKITQKPALQIVHPLYDNFGEAIDKLKARHLLGLPKEEKIILFFGFIRKYKGLDILIEAMSQKLIQESGIKLLIAGEFYEEPSDYTNLITKLNLQNCIYLRTEFIPDAAVALYLSAVDFVIQPYRNATQSGVTPLAYHFEKPMLVTNVGGLPDLVPEGKVGVIAEPNPLSISQKILDLYSLGEAHFLPHLREEKKKYSWSVLVNTIEQLAAK